MRVTGGILSGRTLIVPKTGVRPTQDMVRQALFSILRERVIDARFLDLFGGAGTVGIEAWSRGAAEVVWVEEDRRIAAILKENLQRCGIGNGRVVVADVARVVKKGVVGGPFDIIFADPPYGAGSDGERVNPWQERLLTLVQAGGVLASGGCLVLELAARGAEHTGDGWVLADERVYGSTVLRFFRLAEVPGDGKEAV